MKNKIVQANLCLIGAKVISGLNTNALKYLLPLWILPLSAVSLRCIFGTIVFWILSFLFPKDKLSTKDKILLLLLGATFIYGYLFFFQIGLSKTTPVSSSIFTSIQPIWVFIIAALFFHEKISFMKVIGIIIGFSGALLCILTQQSSDLASDAWTGNILCLLSSLAYAIYLTAEKIFLSKNIQVISILKYTFTGAAISSLIATGIEGFHAPVLSIPIDWKPFSILLFVLIFPTILGYILMPMGLKYLKTTVVSIYGYLSLIIVVVVSLILGQDRFSWIQLSAVLLICGSIYFVEIAEKK